MPMRNEDIFVAHFSTAKVLALELSLIVLMWVPFTNFAKENAVYTKALLTSPLYILVIVAVVIMLIMILSIIPLIWRSISKLPALLIDKDQIIVYGVREKRVYIKNITNIKDNGPIGFLITYDSGKTFTVPTFFYKERGIVFDEISRLKSLV